MFNMHDELNDFFKDHVRLKTEQVDALEELRKKNVRRLKAGLNKLGHSGPIRTPVQGGFAMKTLSQTPQNSPDADFDIDTAVLFYSEALPEDPLDARKRVLAGVQEGGGNFRRVPEARTNAVTVWYQGGYHVDLAVHRIVTDRFGNEVIEHAGVDWTPRNPSDITDWFNNRVDLCSPSKEAGATVKEKQMRRIVQLLKYFSKSRPSWALPGGLIISALVSEQYMPDPYRDDKSLYKTMQSICNRLEQSVEIANPVDPAQQLTYKEEYRGQTRRFCEKLSHALEWLSPLFESSCSREEAARAWCKVYKHTYWERLAITEAARARGEALRATSASESLYTDSQGRLSSIEPEGKSVLNQSHRFYGGG